MEAVPLTETRYHEWDAFVGAHPHGSPYHLTAWKELVCRCYGWGSAYFMIYNDSGLAGILPLIRTRSITGSTAFYSLPYAPYGGILSDGTVEAVSALQLCGLENESVFLREARFADTTGVGIVTMVRGLPRTADALWSDLGPKVRNQVRKAEKAGVSFEAGLENYDEVLGVYGRNMKRLGTPMHRVAFYRMLKERYGDMLRVWAVRKGQTVVGGMVAIAFNGTMNDYIASVLTEYNRDCPNMLLYWGALKESMTAGCSQFDFGRSAVGQGTYRFKKQWGAVPVPLSYTRMQQGVAVDAGSVRPNAVTRLWSHLPGIVTDRLGPVLRKYVF